MFLKFFQWPTARSKTHAKVTFCRFSNRALKPRVFRGFLCLWKRELSCLRQGSVNRVESPRIMVDVHVEGGRDTTGFLFGSPAVLVAAGLFCRFSGLLPVCGFLLLGG